MSDEKYTKRVQYYGKDIIAEDKIKCSLHDNC